MSSKIVTFKYDLGDKLKDKVTGYSGVVMVRAQYSTGCFHYGLATDNLKDGATQNWEWFDVSRLNLVKENVVNFDLPENAIAPSGPFPKGPQQ